MNEALWGAIGDVRRTLYVWSMNLHKPRVRDETKKDQLKALIRACKAVAEVGEELLKETEREG